LLLALLEEHDPGVNARFAELGMRPAEVLADLRRTLGTGDDRSWDGILVTPRFRSVVARAEAAVRNGDLVEPIDLLGALLAEPGGLAADVLARNLGNPATSGRVAG
jgi:hypothetical protein